MSSNTCGRCRKTFNRPCDLRRHQQRKFPCDESSSSSTTDDQSLSEEFDKLVLNEVVQDHIQDAEHSAAAMATPPANTRSQCPHCFRFYSTPSSLGRHIRTNCRFAEIEYAVDGLAKKLATMLMAALVPMGDNVNVVLNNVVNNVQNIQNHNVLNGVLNNVQNIQNNNVQNTIVIIPWDSENRIRISPEDIIAAFKENGKLREFENFDSGQMTDPAVSSSHIAELYVDLIKRIHQDPCARNIYLNPRRADQVMVYRSRGTWDVECLHTASEQLLDGVASSMNRIALYPTGNVTLSSSTRNAVAIAKMMYDSDHAEYLAKVKAPLVAHLSNTAPPANTIVIAAKNEDTTAL